MDQKRTPRPILLLPFLACLLFTAVSAVPGYAAGVTPPSVSLLPGQGMQVTLAWTIAGAGTWTSPQGDFQTRGLGVIYTNAVPLSITGSGTESVLIPASVVATALQNGESTITYRRSFTPPAGGPADIGDLTILVITSQAAGPFSVRRVELYFVEDGSRVKEVTVDRNARGLELAADVTVNGTGTLEGYWEVDGRRLENVRKFVSLGSTATVEVSDVPGLPTYGPGRHSVRLVITGPAPSFDPPRIDYVVASRSDAGIRSLVLLSPGVGEEVTAGTLFSWQPYPPAAAYTVTFSKEEGGEAVLSAQTPGGSYSLPARLLAERFSPGGAYRWQVRGYDRDGEPVAESPERVMRVGRGNRARD